MCLVYITESAYCSNQLVGFLSTCWLKLSCVVPSHNKLLIFQNQTIQMFFSTQTTWVLKRIKDIIFLNPLKSLNSQGKGQTIAFLVESSSLAHSVLGSECFLRVFGDSYTIAYTLHFSQKSTLSANFFKS